MWISLTPLTLFLIIHGCHAAEEVPRNQDNINSYSYSGRPHDCSEVSAQGLKTDGVYLIYPGGLPTPIPVYCDMTGKDGPWTVFQKRFDGTVNFYQGWKEYKAGIGRADGEYWLGLQHIHLLTLRKSYRLRIDLEDWDNVASYVTYENFSLSHLAINPEEDGYKLHIEGFTEGDPDKPIGDSLAEHVGMKFSTYDYDRDIWSSNCAQSCYGAFWYSDCYSSNLNGKYHKAAATEYITGLVWKTAKGYYYSFKKTVMKIAPSVPMA